MDTARQMKADQAELWNGAAGRAWVSAQDILDRMFLPFEEMLADEAAAQRAASVLDIGCGTGATTLAAARRLPDGGRCTGVDISRPMIALARTRAETDAPAGVVTRFIADDAETCPFEAGSADLVMSRFGVMFFTDPVAAFANLRRAAVKGAPLRAIVWRSAAENPFMTTAERAAAPFLPNLPARDPDGPGQFAFADSGRVERILEESGWTDIDIAPLDAVCTLTEPDLTRYLSHLGPVGLALQDADAQTRDSVVRTVRAAFDPYVQGTDVRFTTACWMIGARA